MNDDFMFGLIMTMHFPNIVAGDFDSLCCKECQDFKDRICKGKNLQGHAVIGCMGGKIKNMVFNFHDPTIN